LLFILPRLADKWRIPQYIIKLRIFFFPRQRFNTLAESGTGNTGKQALILCGKGTELTNSKALKGRAKRKTITQTMMLSMVAIASENESSDRLKSYWNTYYCQSEIHTANGRLYGNYCKNRFCTLCCSIRKADIINRYLPVVKSWEEPYFVTLTVKAVSHARLQKVMRSMMKAFTRITETYRKRSQRGKGIKLVGIRSLESNFNPTTKTYNPHFHVIVANSEMAEILITEWLKRSKRGWTSKKAQKKSKITNSELALIEIVKYGSKIFTEPDINKKVRLKGSSKVYALALSNIFNAMKGLRIFDRFGFNLPSLNIPESSNVSIVKNYDKWAFNLGCFDWANTETGEKLSEFIPVSELIELLQNNIDLNTG
jgi:hypothetical protein